MCILKTLAFENYNMESFNTDKEGLEMETHIMTSTGVHLPRFLLEPQSLSSKKDRERRNPRYMPPAPRPHSYGRSAPAQTRLLHSRLGNESHDLDNSFHLLTSTAGQGASFFRANFAVQERLGFGSFGDVYRALCKLDGKEYAVKKTRRVYTSENDKSRQLREVLRMASIESNSHVVELETAWEEDGHLFFQMELCLKSLSQDIEEGHLFSESEVWDVLVDMLFALEHLHKHLLVHMDVKPENIFLTIATPTRYKIGDFGIIVCLKEKRDLSEFTEGDSRYLAPEVMQGVVTTKADVFSLGLTILEIACHVDLPKGGSLWHHLRQDKLPEPCNLTVPESLLPVLRAMLTSDVTQRPEIKDILNRPDVQAHIVRRNWMMRVGWIKNGWHAIVNIWKRVLTFLLSLVLFKTSDKDTIRPETDRSTPEPYIIDGDPPNILINDNSFSDDEDSRHTPTSNPVFASTPISQSQNRSGGRLRSSRVNRIGTNGVLKPVGSPTSRNLLKEFEACRADD